MIIGQIVGEFGLKGMVKVAPMTDFPERFEPGNTVFVLETPYEILDVQVHKSQVRLKLKGITKVEQAEALKWESVCVAADDRPELYEDEYYTQDLEGLSLVLESGQVVGKVDRILAGPAQDLIVTGENMIPMVREFVLKIDIKKGQIVIRPIPGLLDDAAVEARGSVD
ncbi:MAG: 16S rRNA processing protein RimM [Chthonomonas sp.]|nr:16S rRNA processing protein RimM [Chthonomonas sp.]